MKKLLGALFVVATFVLVAGCNKGSDAGSGGSGGSGGGGGGAASGGSIGVKECDDYVAKYEGCFSKMDPIAKTAAEPGFKAQRDAFKQSAQAATTPEAKAALANSCKQAMAALANNPACK